VSGFRSSQSISGDEGFANNVYIGFCEQKAFFKNLVYENGINISRDQIRCFRQFTNVWNDYDPNFGRIEKIDFYQFSYFVMTLSNDRKLRTASAQAARTKKLTGLPLPDTLRFLRGSYN
jgi:hypothetical protein